jgi:hypothetical protein
MLTREEAIVANKLLVQATKSFQNDESDYHIVGAHNKSLEISNITLETAANPRVKWLLDVEHNKQLLRYARKSCKAVLRSIGNFLSSRKTNSKQEKTTIKH